MISPRLNAVTQRAMGGNGAHLRKTAELPQVSGATQVLSEGNPADLTQSKRYRLLPLASNRPAFQPTTPLPWAHRRAAGYSCISADLASV